MTTRRSKGGPDSSHAGPAQEGMISQPGGGAGDAYAYGIAVKQMDALDRLLRMLAAHGDLLATTQATDLAQGTLPAIGEALHTHALAMRDILDQVEMQRLDEVAGRQGRVEEPHAVYAVTPLRMAALH
ncbi:hypothetical protein LY625_09690 [Lysobacter sp. GX 14042]|uniref:hypothetical protein n=1 Tax=Lysobacter sp. GX 14042 TaxID=2907155 RepID=UPI001F263393|nr:hypothetical protein [Lysobacter sp. GX 14042]MCE7032879.1 hypothetical protein [Lysobacter sp. GX 14042]